MGAPEFIAAVLGGESETALAMLEADPALADTLDEGVSIVMKAVYYGHIELAGKIAERKQSLDLFEASVLGIRALVAEHLAEDPSGVATFSEDGFTPLGFAAFFGHRDLVLDLLKAGADPSRRSNNGLRVTPLHSALSNGHREIAKDLIEAGASVTIAAAEGWTPLHYAAHEGDEETARLLLARGADPGTKRDDGLTPAEVARDRGHEKLAETLS